MLSGTVTVVFGGVTMLYDIYRLNSEVRELAGHGPEGALHIRQLALKLEESLENIRETPDTRDEETDCDFGEPSETSSTTVAKCDSR